MRRCILLLVTIACCCGTLRGQSIAVVRPGKHATQSLPIIHINGVAFATVRDLATTVEAQVSTGHDGMRMFDAHGSAVFRERTPFVWTSGVDGRRLLQLLLEPVLRNGSLYVPVGSTVRILKPVLSTPLTYDPVLERLTVGVVEATHRDTMRSMPRTVHRDTVMTIPRHTHRDSIRSIVAEARANGILIRIDFRNTATKLPAPIAQDSTTITIPLGTVVVDTSIAKLDADGAIYEHAFLRDTGSLIVQLRTVDPVQSISRQYARGSYSILLRTSRSTKSSKEQRAGRDRWKTDLIVLDAGHGGTDPGAQGLGGTNEKDVTLGVVLKLGRLLEREGFTVVYTRKTDVFVELYRRAQIANEARGKLFISVHCNSMPTKPNPANGFESYILRPGKNETAVRVAERENNVIKLEQDRTRYGGMTEEAFIVAAMAQSGFVKHSERFAALVQDELGKHLAGAKNNGVSQAGFLVLVGASMPNILIETGYVSNTREERILASSSGQERIAAGIAAAVRRYRSSYEPHRER